MVNSGKCRANRKLRNETFRVTFTCKLSLYSIPSNMTSSRTSEINIHVTRTVHNSPIC